MRCMEQKIYNIPKIISSHWFEAQFSTIYYLTIYYYGTIWIQDNYWRLLDHCTCVMAEPNWIGRRKVVFVDFNLFSKNLYFVFAYISHVVRLFHIESHFVKASIAAQIFLFSQDPKILLSGLVSYMSDDWCFKYIRSYYHRLMAVNPSFLTFKTK